MQERRRVCLRRQHLNAISFLLTLLHIGCLFGREWLAGFSRALGKNNVPRPSPPHSGLHQSVCPAASLFPSRPPFPPAALPFHSHHNEDIIIFIYRHDALSPTAGYLNSGAITFRAYGWPWYLFTTASLIDKSCANGKLSKRGKKGGVENEHHEITMDFYPDGVRCWLRHADSGNAIHGHGPFRQTWAGLPAEG